MFNTIFFNFWVALITFAVYFIWIIVKSNGSAMPLPTILFSFLWGTVGFIFAFVIRSIITYVTYTPEIPEIGTEQMKEESSNGQAQVTQNEAQTSTLPPTSTVEFQDESSEEIAQVVRTMLNHDEPSIEK